MLQQTTHSQQPKASTKYCLHPRLKVSIEQQLKRFVPDPQVLHLPVHCSIVKRSLYDSCRQMSVEAHLVPDLSQAVVIFWRVFPVDLLLAPIRRK